MYRGLPLRSASCRAAAATRTTSCGSSASSTPGTAGTTLGWHTSCPRHYSYAASAASAASVASLLGLAAGPGCRAFGSQRQGSGTPPPLLGRRIPLSLQRACNACLPPRRDMGRSKDGINLSDDKIGDLVSSWMSSSAPEPQPQPSPNLTLTR